jgi:hypothetical protein
VQSPCSTMLDPDIKYEQVVAALATMAADIARSSTKIGLLIARFSRN